MKLTHAIKCLCGVCLFAIGLPIASAWDPQTDDLNSGPDSGYYAYGDVYYSMPDDNDVSYVIGRAELVYDNSEILDEDYSPSFFMLPSSGSGIYGRSISGNVPDEGAGMYCTAGYLWWNGSGGSDNSQSPHTCVESI